MLGAICLASLPRVSRESAGTYAGGMHPRHSPSSNSDSMAESLSEQRSNESSRKNFYDSVSRLRWSGAKDLVTYARCSAIDVPISRDTPDLSSSRFTCDFYEISKLMSPRLSRINIGPSQRSKWKYARRAIPRLSVIRFALRLAYICGISRTHTSTRTRRSDAREKQFPSEDRLQNILSALMRLH